MSQSDIARALGLTQPSISSALKSAAKIPDPPAGFSGASVYEIAQRFTAGKLAREDLVDQLGRWQDPNTRSAREQRRVDDELTRALRDGLLDDAVYRAVLDRRQRLGRPSHVIPTATAAGE
ncbi:hypothetical protein [Microlunatus endophyticus]|nr:hypothetical protein [Microlunatus endophyticus]